MAEHGDGIVATRAGSKSDVPDQACEAGMNTERGSYDELTVEALGQFAGDDRAREVAVSHEERYDHDPFGPYAIEGATERGFLLPEAAEDAIEIARTAEGIGVAMHGLR
jgi:hypothetical protein